MTVSKSQVLNLYKNLLREASKFPAYNFRMYGLRRVKDSFQENKNLQDLSQIDNKFRFGRQQLEVLRRQVLIGGMFRAENLVVENCPAQ